MGDLLGIQILTYFLLLLSFHGREVGAEEAVAPDPTRVARALFSPGPGKPSVIPMVRFVLNAKLFLKLIFWEKILLGIRFDESL